MAFVELMPKVERNHGRFMIQPEAGLFPEESSTSDPFIGKAPRSTDVESSFRGYRTEPEAAWEQSDI